MDPRPELQHHRTSALPPAPNRSPNPNPGLTLDRGCGLGGGSDADGGGGLAPSCGGGLGELGLGGGGGEAVRACGGGELGSGGDGGGGGGAGPTAGLGGLRGLEYSPEDRSHRFGGARRAPSPWHFGGGTAFGDVGTWTLQGDLRRVASWPATKAAAVWGVAKPSNPRWVGFAEPSGSVLPEPNGGGPAVEHNHRLENHPALGFLLLEGR